MSAQEKKSNKDGGLTCGLLSDTSNTLRKHPRPSLSKDGQSSSTQTQSPASVPSTVTVGETFTRTPRPTSLTLPFQNRQRESHLVTDDDLNTIMKRHGFSGIPSMPSHRSSLRIGMDLGRSSSGRVYNYGGEGSKTRGTERQRPASMSLGGVSQRFDIDTGKPLPVGSLPYRDPTLTALPNPPTKCDLAVYPDSDMSEDEDTTPRRRVSREKVDIYAAMADDAYYESVASQSSKAVTVTAPPPTRVSSPFNSVTNNRPGHKRKFSTTMANMVESVKKRMKRPESTNLSNVTTVAATPTSFLGPADLMRNEHESSGEGVTPQLITPSQDAPSQQIPSSPAASDNDSDTGTVNRYSTHSDSEYDGPIRPGETYQDAMNRIVYGPRMMAERNKQMKLNAGRVDSNATTNVNTSTDEEAQAYNVDDKESTAIDINTTNDMDIDIDAKQKANEKSKSKSMAMAMTNPLKQTWSAIQSLKHKQYNPFAPLFAPKEPDFDMIDPSSRSRQPRTSTTTMNMNISAPFPIPTVPGTSTDETPSPFLTTTTQTPTAIARATSPLLTPLPAPWQTLPRPILASEIARLENRTMELLEREGRNVREIEWLRGRVGALERGRIVSGGVGGSDGVSSGVAPTVAAERRKGVVGLGGLGGASAGASAGNGTCGEDGNADGDGDGDVEMTEEERRKTWMTVEE